MLLAFVFGLLGCAPAALEDPRTPTGSSTLAADARFEAVYAVNVDEGTVSRTLNGMVDAEIDVGGEPTRIARAGDRLYVTLRTERSVAVIAGDQVVSRIEVGTEPVGIVADEDGRSLFVAVSLDHVVVRIDPATNGVVERYPVEHEPRWLALHPSGKALFVGSVYEGQLTRVDLRTGTTEVLSVPATTLEGPEGEVALTVRITGDLTITPDGSALAAPSVIVDNTTPVEQPDGEEKSDGYASQGAGVSRFNPALLLYELTAAGRIKGEATVLFLTTSIQEELGGLGLVRSYPSSVTAAPNGKLFVVTLEASDAVAVVGRIPFPRSQRRPRDMDGARFDTGGGGAATGPEQAGMESYPRAVVSSSRGPRGVLFVERGRAVVHSFLDRTLADLGYEEAQDVVQSIALGGFSGEVLATRPGVSLARPSLPESVERGRSLFYSAVDGRMAGSGAGVSCSTCHFDGRTDGLTWTFEDGVRQTPSLAGRVSETVPVTWTDNVPGVAEEAQITSQGRMGGEGISPRDLEDLEAYIDWTRLVQSPPRESELVALGAEIFARVEVGCSSCHSGERFTDNEHHEILGVSVNTPSLSGVVATPPYFHNGTARDLRAVVDFAVVGGMGDASMLTAREQDALVAYLSSL